MRGFDQGVADREQSGTIRPVARDALIHHLNAYLDIARFRDPCFNGLQIEGEALVSRVVVGVTANLQLIEAAIAARAQLVVAHHGLLWKGDDPRLVRSHGRRVATAISAGLNVAAYHLPLDVHPEVGNNAQLARRLQLTLTGCVGDCGLVSVGRLGEGAVVDSRTLAAHVARAFGPRVALYARCSRPVRTIAWCTGAGGSLLSQAIEAGADAYITGEVSEHHVHLARESGIALITAGHHATERGGVSALAAYVTRQFGVECQFIDIDSPL